MRLDFVVPPPTYPEYAELHEQARRSSRIVDPANVYLPDRIAGRRGGDWAAAVIGRPYNGVRSISCVESRLIELADAANINPALPQWLLDDRAAAAEHRRLLDEKRSEARRRDEQAWATVRGACSVELEVRPNLTAGIRNGQRQNLGHAVPVTDAMSGTRRRHAAGRAICEATSRRPMRLGEPTDAPATCVRCLDWAPKIRPAVLAASNTGSSLADGDDR